MRRSHCNRSWVSATRLRLVDLILVARFLHGVGLRADPVGHGALFAAKAIQSGKNLRALLRQILESRGECAQQLRVRVGSGLCLEVRDRRLDIGDRNPPLRHFRDEIGNIGLVAPGLRVQIELRPGPDGGERKSRSLDLRTGPIRISLDSRLRACLRRRSGDNRNREDDAERNMQGRFHSGAIIGLPTFPIKPPGFADASSGASKHPRDSVIGDRAFREASR